MGKKKSTEDEGKSKFELALEKLDKAYGKGTVISLDSKVKGEYDTISTGSIGFDWITLGVGGFVKGRMYELMGWEGVGKSTICGHAVAECQKKGWKALYIDGENAVDKNYFKALGIDTEKMLIAQPNSGEEGFTIAMEMINSGEVDLVIIDSDSSLIPKKVVDGDVGDSAIGRKAMLNSNAYPKLKAALVHNKVCVLVISQYREKIGVMFGNPTTTQGGHALKFYSDCRIEITRSLAKDKEDVTYGNITKVKAIKNKLASPYRSSNFEIVYGKGIDWIKELIELGVNLNVIEKSGTWYSFEGSKMGQIAAMTDLLNDNEELCTALKRAIVDKIRDIPVVIEEIQNEDV